MFDKLKFHSKKFKDYLDFKLIVTLIYQGKHLTTEGKSIIFSIANRMNNNRLTTNTKSITSIIDNTKIKSILELKPLFIKDLEGRVKNILINKYIRSVYIIEASLYNGKIIKYHNAVACSKDLNLSNSTIIRQINDNKPFQTERGIIKLRRIIIFNNN